MFTIRLRIFILHNYYLNMHITCIKSRSVTIRSRLTVFVLNVFTADLNFIPECAPKIIVYTHDDILQCPPQNVGPKTLGVGVIHSLVFSVRGRAGRNQSPVM